MHKQAELISAWIEGESDGNPEEDGKAIIIVLNLSATPIYEVIVSIVKNSADISRPRLGGKSNSSEYSSFISIIPPGKYKTTVSNDYHGMMFSPAVEIAFTDSNMKSWIRRNNGSLIQINKRPIEYYNLDSPQKWNLPGPDIS